MQVLNALAGIEAKKLHRILCEKFTAFSICISSERIIMFKSSSKSIENGMTAKFEYFANFCVISSYAQLLSNKFTGY